MLYQARTESQTVAQEQWLGLVQVFLKMENCSPDQLLTSP